MSNDYFSILAQARQKANAETKSEDGMVTIKREQKSISPAIAQLWIKFPASMSQPESITTFFQRQKNANNIEAAVHNINKFDTSEYYVEIQGVMHMYQWMEYFIQSVLREYGPKGKGYPVSVKGNWDKYQNEVANQIYGLNQY